MSIRTSAQESAKRDTLAKRRAVADSGITGVAPSPTVGKQDSNLSKAADMLTGYIPTESITLYVAALAALPAMRSSGIKITNILIYWIGAGLTLIIFGLIYVAERRAAQKSLPRLLSRDFPWWGLIASFVGFLAWAVAVPGGPYLTGEAGGLVGAFLALVTATFLDLIGKALEPTTSG